MSKAMARSTLRHRIGLRPEAELEGATRRVLDGILASRPGAPLVVLTGRIGLVALIGVIPIAFSMAATFRCHDGGRTGSGRRRRRLRGQTSSPLLIGGAATHPLDWDNPSTPSSKSATTDVAASGDGARRLATECPGRTPRAYRIDQCRPVHQ